MSKTCKDCKFYGVEVRQEDGSLVGHCFRNPPQMTANGAAMPPVKPDMPVCGEFKRKGWFK